MMGTHEEAKRMDRPEPTPETTNVVVLRTTGAPGPELSALFEQALRVAVGATALAVVAAADAVSRTLGFAEVSDEEQPDEEPPPVRGFPLVAGAAFGLAWETGRWGVRAASTLGRSVAPLASFAASPGFVRRRLDAVEARLAGLDRRWQEELPRNEGAAEAFVRALVPGVVSAALDQIDLTQIVIDRVDLGRVVEEVDVEAVIARVPIDDIVARLDLDEVVQRVDLDAIVRRIDLDAAVRRVDLQGVLDRIDVDAIVGRVDLETIVDRIDVDAVAERIDIQAIVERLDLAGIATRVIEEIDLPQIIRASSESMATEAAEGIRVQSMEADRLVAGVVDRVLRRRRGRETEVDEGRETASPAEEERS
jgi:hypothetical protein